jgi:hypothetical protein
MRRLSTQCWRIAVVLHRWIGAVLGVLMLGWCVSGMVMMYVPFPALDQASRVAALPVLDFRHCCNVPADFEGAEIDSAEIEMLGLHVLMRLRRSGARDVELLDLTSGRRLEAISDSQALGVAEDFGAVRGYAATPRPTGRLMYDQWTIESTLRASGPLLTFAWDDRRAPVLYISSRSGKAVQLTEGTQRFWNYLGSIPHWIYFLPLRESPQLWSQIVIGTSLVGAVLTLLGLLIGFVQLWRMRNHGRWSPYRGINYWHHVPGTLCGALVLSWVASGLFSMNPWGFLADDTSHDEPARLTGLPVSGTDVHRCLDALRAMRLGTAVSVQMTRLDGRLFLTAVNWQQLRARFDESGGAAPLSDAEVAYIGKSLGQGFPISPPTRLFAGDSYYFPHHRDRPAFPVYRFRRADSEGTLYYVDAIDGSLRRRVGRADRGYRWLHQALHRFDFIEKRPWWDVVMLTLMLSVTVVCATGLILGIQRWVRTAWGG